MNFQMDITLETDRVRLLPLEIDHYADLLPVVNANPNLLRYSPSLLHTGDHLRAYLRVATEARKEERRYPFIIFDKSARRYVGSTSYGNVSSPDLRLEIGWTWIDKEVQGSGLNRQAKFLLLRYAFGELGYERVEFKTDRRNEQSKRAIAKIGGVEEGTLRSHTLMSDGYRRDTVCFSILRGEWEQLRQTKFADL